MKKIFFVLLLSLAAKNLVAQKGWYIIENEQNKMKADFHYWGIQKNISMDVEFHNIKQLPYLPNIDSIITLVKQDLQYLSDSLKEDGIVRKLDYLVTPMLKKITITNHTEQPISYTVQNKELKQFKNAVDTLVIKLGVFNGDSISYVNNGKKEKLARCYPVYIKFYLNNLKDILELKNELVGICMNDIKSKIEKNKYAKRQSEDLNYGSSKLVNPAFEKDIVNYWNIKMKPKKSLEPVAGFGFQNINSIWLPSFSYGLRYGTKTDDGKITNTDWYLTLDNYYNYSGIGTSQQKREVYRYLTLKFVQTDPFDKKQNGFQFKPSLSLGYLISKSGDFFPGNSFKLSTHLIQSGWLSIGPELFFNDFFKSTSLGIKLSFNYE